MQSYGPTTTTFGQQQEIVLKQDKGDRKPHILQAGLSPWDNIYTHYI